MSSPAQPAYLVFDTESIPDGVLLAKTRFPDKTPAEAIALAQEQARAKRGSDFLNVSYHVPVAVCVARVGADFRLQSLRCIDTPEYRPAEIARGFWKGLAALMGQSRARLVTFNGRGFDLPLLELAAYRYGLEVPHHFGGGKQGSRFRYGDGHIDLMEFLTNYGAFFLEGGLNLLSKLLGKPGKQDIKGSDVYQLYCDGQRERINHYCSFDVLDTYFVFLRTRVMTGELTLDKEQELVREMRQWIETQSAEQPHLAEYLKNWGEWQPWP